MLKALFLAGAALAFVVAVLGAETLAPERFHTSARFTVDGNELALTTAVGLREPHPRVPGLSWMHVYFYAFPFTSDDVIGVAKGSVDQLDQKRMRVATTARDRNLSRAVLHFLIEKDSTVSNVSLEVPGVTCTIAESPDKVTAAFSEYRFDGSAVTVRGRGTFECDLQSIGMGKRLLGWNVSANVPAFDKH